MQVNSLASLQSYIAAHELALGFKPAAVGLHFADYRATLLDAGCSEWQCRLTNLEPSLYGVRIVRLS